MRIRHLPWQRSAGTSISPIESASRRIPGARMPIRMSCIWGWVRAFTASLLSASGGMRFAFLTYVRCFTGRCRVEKVEALSAVGAGGMAECGAAPSAALFPPDETANLHTLVIPGKRDGRHGCGSASRRRPAGECARAPYRKCRRRPALRHGAMPPKSGFAEGRSARPRDPRR